MVALVAYISVQFRKQPILKKNVGTKHTFLAPFRLTSVAAPARTATTVLAENTKRLVMWILLGIWGVVRAATLLCSRWVLPKAHVLSSETGSPSDNRRPIDLLPDWFLTAMRAFLLERGYSNSFGKLTLLFTDNLFGTGVLCLRGIFASWLFWVRILISTTLWVCCEGVKVVVSSYPLRINADFSILAFIYLLSQYIVDYYLWLYSRLETVPLTPIWGIPSYFHGEIDRPLNSVWFWMVPEFQGMYQFAGGFIESILSSVGQPVRWFGTKMLDYTIGTVGGFYSLAYVSECIFLIIGISLLMWAVVPIRIGHFDGFGLIRWFSLLVVLTRLCILWSVGTINLQPDLVFSRLYLITVWVYYIATFVFLLFAASVGIFRSHLQLGSTRSAYLFTASLAVIEYAVASLIAANDLLSSVMAVELLSISSILIFLTIFKQISADIVLRYVIFNAFGSNCMVLGFWRIYSETSFTDFMRLKWLFGEFAGTMVKSGVPSAPGLLLVGILLKFASLPGSIVGQIVYARAGSVVMIIFLVFMKIGYLSFWVKVWVLSAAGELSFTSFSVVGSVALISLVVGAFGAVGVTAFGPFVVYSSLQHVGYILAAVATSHGSTEFTSVPFFYGLAYFTTVFPLLCLAAWLNTNAATVFERIRPSIAGLFVVYLCSLLGCPPFAGFFSKFFVFGAAARLSAPFLTWVSVGAAAVSVFYYGRMALGIIMPFFSENQNKKPGVTLKDDPDTVFALYQARRNMWQFVFSIFFFGMAWFILSDLLRECLWLIIFLVSPYGNSSRFLKTLAGFSTSTPSIHNDPVSTRLYHWPSTLVFFLEQNNYNRETTYHGSYRYSRKPLMFLNFSPTPLHHAPENRYLRNIWLGEMVDQTLSRPDYFNHPVFTDPSIQIMPVYELHDEQYYRLWFEIFHGVSYSRVRLHSFNPLFIHDYQMAQNPTWFVDQAAMPKTSPDDGFTLDEIENLK